MKFLFSIIILIILHHVRRNINLLKPILWKIQKQKTIHTIPEQILQTEYFQ
jgi:hypothetical protein